MDGSAVAMTAPSNWCMNWAPPTISGMTRTERDISELARSVLGKSVQPVAWRPSAQLLLQGARTRHDHCGRFPTVLEKSAISYGCDPAATLRNSAYRDGPARPPSSPRRRRHAITHSGSWYDSRKRGRSQRLQEYDEQFDPFSRFRSRPGDR